MLHTQEMALKPRGGNPLLPPWTLAMQPEKAQPGATLYRSARVERIFNRQERD